MKNAFLLTMIMTFTSTVFADINSDAYLLSQIELLENIKIDAHTTETPFGNDCRLFHTKFISPKILAKDSIFEIQKVKLTSRIVNIDLKHEKFWSILCKIPGPIRIYPDYELSDLEETLQPIASLNLPETETLYIGINDSEGIKELNNNSPRDTEAGTKATKQ